ncbi:MAG: hypothetical protein ABR549_00510 [Mycobacteriales bacterium]
MKRLLLSLDGMPLPLRALSAYSALCAWALIVIGLTELVRGADEAWVLLSCAVSLLVAARAMTIPIRLVWWSLVIAASGALVTAVWLDNNASAGCAVALVILSWPTTRVFFGEGDPLPERIRS